MTLNPLVWGKALLIRAGIWPPDPRPPALQSFRSRAGSPAAFVFVHGFGGDTKETWGQFPQLLIQDPSATSWDIHAIGYPSTLRIDVPIWDADPSLATLATGLRTTLSLPPFSDYKALAIAGHSMGGLVIQRAVLDDRALSKRLSHVVLFGTPSAGLQKASFARFLKRQAKDMGADATFIRDLRRDWRTRFPKQYSFEFRVVAGDRDEFVPTASSLEPFADEYQLVVPGNHLEIVKPASKDDLGVRLIVDLLAGHHPARGVVDGARLAVERRDFHRAVLALQPRAKDLDDAALVILALALEGLGKGGEALSLLEKNYRGPHSSTDVLGVLAGRLKRRWLAERVEADRLRAKQLYERALEESERGRSHDQAYYHAINVAFLDLMVTPPGSSVPSPVLEMARRAQVHCAQAAATYWRFATEGEAHLILGGLESARQSYEHALAQKPNPRSIDSMYLQAVQVAARVHGERGVRELDQIFNVSSA